ncbi:hypothetical protein EB118_25350 [bacterium]|nr:hypothetical protein [Synechococcaceae bacterium WB6_1A_059]NDG33370.1 hypothetical protein [bacterium]NDG79890.1 hypothetical protein [Synechococcaceae bacterium WB8_1B_057]
MQILTLDNQTFYLNELPDEIENDLRFVVLDNSDNQNPDYFFIPLIFLESFTGPAVVLEIGKYEITMPLDWCTIVGDTEGPEMEVLPLTSLNDRGFKTFCFNPLSSFKPEFLDIDIIDVYQDVKWYFPKMRSGQLLCTPLEPGPKPICAYFVKEVSRQSEIINYTQAW